MVFLEFKNSVSVLPLGDLIKRNDNNKKSTEFRSFHISAYVHTCFFGFFYSVLGFSRDLAQSMNHQ